MKNAISSCVFLNIMLFPIYKCEKNIKIVRPSFPEVTTLNCLFCHTNSKANYITITYTETLHYITTSENLKYRMYTGFVKHTRKRME